MLNSKKHVFTGSAIVLMLVALVFSNRVLHKSEASIMSNNFKVKGPASAPIHMVIYSDFQCPACKVAIEPEEALINEFRNSIRFEFRHFPLERPHRWALTAASFAECAGEQGKFWPLHDKLYQEQSVWSVSDDAITILAGYSRDLGLDPNKLSACLGNPKTLNRIKAERATGEKKGVQSTPTIFINDKMLVGGLQLKEKGKDIVLQELKKK